MSIEELFNEPVNRYQYSLGHIHSFIHLVLDVLPMRATERVLDFFSTLFPTKSPKVPSWHSGRLWLLKLGYYKLYSCKEQHDDWIWIVDHASQWGSEKCFVVLGIREHNLPKEKILSLDDIEPLMVQPMANSNGEIVQQQLKNLARDIGIPTAIVADKGPDIKLGINRFCDHTQSTVYLYDIKHLVANLLKYTFEKDEFWQPFLTSASECRKCMQQTSIAGLSPPNQRSKARYMNIDILLDWAVKILPYLESDIYPEEIDKEIIVEKLGWVFFYKEDLIRWKCILDMSKVAERLIRSHGYKIGITEKLICELMPLSKCDHRCRIFQEKLVNAIFKEESKIKHFDQELLGSSEVIESLFGKFKNFESDQSKSGFTSSCLALAAMVGKVDSSIIKSAMESITVEKISDWKSQYISTSVQSQRVMWLGNKKAQKRDEKLVA